MKNALQLKISLAGIKPLIWRRVVVNNDLSLEDMSSVILTIMPWHGGHLHQFTQKEKYYMSPYPEAEYEDDLESMKEYLQTTIGDLLKAEGDFLKFEYDFGDSWMHNISVEKVLPPLEGRRASYVKGKNMAPPDDCGGVYGYAHLKEVMADPNHPEYPETAEWLMMDEDEIFDPTYIGCDSEDIDDMLSEI